MESIQREEQYKSVKRVLWAVLIANLTITVIKIFLGAITGSLAVVADGFHSMVDSSSNLIGLAAIRLAGRPADDRYPYGYQRFETIGALGIGGLLLVAAWEIVKSVFDGFLEGSQPEITGLTFGIIALTFIVNLGVVILETRAGKLYGSQILLADAAHTKTDLFVTGSVIASLVGVWLGWNWLDLVVAGAVVVLILRASVKILGDAAGSLADIARVDPEAVVREAIDVPGVRYVHNVRSRGNADAVFADLHVKVDPAMSTSQAHAVASEVERRVSANIPAIVDAVVHIEPAYHEKSSVGEQITYSLRQIAEGLGLSLHDLHIHVDPDGVYFIELDLEIGGGKTLKEAHDLADEFEKRALAYWPDAKQVITHLEPSTQKLLYQSDDDVGDLDKKVNAFIDRIVAPPDQVLDVSIQIVAEHPRVVLKISMACQISLVESHAKVEEIKRRIMSQFPEITRVLIHVEPAEG